MSVHLLKPQWPLSGILTNAFKVLHQEHCRLILTEFCNKG